MAKHLVTSYNYLDNNRLYYLVWWIYLSISGFRHAILEFPSAECNNQNGKSIKVWYINSFIQWYEIHLSFQEIPFRNPLNQCQNYVFRCKLYPYLWSGGNATRVAQGKSRVAPHSVPPLSFFLSPNVTEKFNFWRIKYCATKIVISLAERRSRSMPVTSVTKRNTINCRRELGEAVVTDWHIGGVNWQRLAQLASPSVRPSTATRPVRVAVMVSITSHNYRKLRHFRPLGYMYISR